MFFIILPSLKLTRELSHHRQPLGRRGKLTKGLRNKVLHPEQYCTFSRFQLILRSVQFEKGGFSLILLNEVLILWVKMYSFHKKPLKWIR